jgi:hypothetical protein
MESHINASDIREALVGYEIINVRKKRGGEFKDEQMTLTLRDPKTKEELKARVIYYSSDHEIWVQTYHRTKKSAKKKKRQHQWVRIGDAGTCVHETDIYECSHCKCRATCPPRCPHLINLKDYPPCVSPKFMADWRRKRQAKARKWLDKK